MDSKVFFQQVYREATGKAVIVLPNYQGKPTLDHWFNYPEQLDDMVELVESRMTGDVWYSPNLFSTESRTKEASKVVSVLAADADTCDPINFRVAPSLIVQTSDGRTQVYWYTEELVPDKAAKINRRIAQVHKGQGCDTAFVNAAKLLRVPGTSNSKHPGDVVFVAEANGDEYDVLDIVKKYPESEVPDVVDVENIAAPDDLEQYYTENRKNLLNGIPNSPGLRDMLFGQYHADKRSDVRYKLLCELYRLGLEDKAVIALAWGSPSNKYRTDETERRGFAGLWAEAMRAKADVLKEGDHFDEPVDNGTGEPKIIKPKPVQRTVFLSSAEQELISDFDVNFIDRWVQWAGTKTDAPSEYHRAAAMTLLSTVYSEFGHAIPKFGALKLNIWFMVLGRSTKDRKSTSRRYLNDALRALKVDDYSYSIGDDVTPGGISLALHDRAHKATVYDRDEVQGLFKELLHQSYMTGGLEVFTKLYDGWSGGRVRASGDKKIMESVPVSFIMFMMGILSETAEILTITNYRSGFLTRFLYVIGNRPTDWIAPPLEQQSEEEEQDDTVFRALVNHLAANRAWWEMKKPNEATYALRADEDAWLRFQQYERDVTRKAEESKYSEIIGTTSERMVISTLKLAALLAMDERSVTIKLSHMLQAIAYAGEWFDNASLVASMVSESEWQRDVDKLEAFINSKGGKVSYSVAYRAFPEKKPKDFEMIIEALVGRGILNRTAQGSRWILEIDYSE